MLILYNGSSCGELCTGTVKSVLPFGLYLDLGGVDGLINLDELSWSKPENIYEEFKVGEVLKVQIIEIDPDGERILLSHKATLPLP